MQIVVTLCDTCHAKEQETEAQSVHRIQLDRKVIDVDLCEPCFDLIENALAVVLAQGRRPDKAQMPVLPKSTGASSRPSAEPRAFVCEFPGCDRSFETFQGVSTHRARTHPSAKPEEPAEPEGHIPCGWEGCDRKFTTGQGASMHRRRIHGNLQGKTSSPKQLASV